MNLDLQNQNDSSKDIHIQSPKSGSNELENSQNILGKYKDIWSKNANGHDRVDHLDY